MLIAFKGFDKDLTCTNHGNTYQYRLGVWNEEDKANCGINGMHCAENPLDCLSYYPDWDRAVYYMVVADGDIDEDAYDSKISCTRLRLIKKLDKGEFVAHSLKYLLDCQRRESCCQRRNRRCSGICKGSEKPVRDYRDRNTCCGWKRDSSRYLV